MEDFDIELLEESRETSRSMQLPLNVLTIGEVENDDVKVYIKQDVYTALEEYAASDTAHELGTILLGTPVDDLGKTHVIISDYIIAKYADSSASTLTFTHKTWDYVHRVHEEKYPEKKIVGWQHTHPGYGIFLSNYDMFIQENFFDVPFHVAYVIDPVQHLRGFFQWKNGKVEKLKGFYIYDDVGKTIKTEQAKAEEESADSGDPEKAKTNTLHNTVTILLSVLTLCLLISTIFLWSRYNEQMKEQASLENRLSELSDSLQEIETAQPATSDEQSPSESDEKDDDTVIRLKAYTVKSGDSLTSICDDAGIDYPSNYRIILSLNGIDNANRISPGQTLLLPAAEMP